MRRARSFVTSAAQLYLDELKHLTVGQPAPEIDGSDLTGKPMKLSDFRGNVVALFFARVDPTKRLQLQPPLLTVVRRMANQPVVLLGVTTASPLPDAPRGSPDRESQKKAIESSELPIRFWYDLLQSGKPGPIQTAWNTSGVIYLIDHRGVIRCKYVARPEFFENGVMMLLKELADEKGRTKKTQ